MTWFTPARMKSLMWVNLWWYLVLASGFALTRVWILALYWLSAAGIMFAAILMSRRL